MRYLIARRIVQIAILALFAFAPSALVMGNLSSSLWFNTIPLSDPFAALQIFLASLSIDLSLLAGALLIFLLYGIFLGRAFCAWVCPINLITDFASFVRQKMGLRASKFIILSKNLRYLILILTLVLSFILSQPVFEAFSYIGIVQRGVIFGGFSWAFVGFVIFVIDAFLASRAVCSHFCPLGAFYAFISRYALLKVRYHLSKCTKCFKCVEICPERQVLAHIGKEQKNVLSGECIRCGRCIEVCDDDALEFSIFDIRRKNV
ncbi:quinol dehydrogenase ferredoxin subunit NapH [Campylobacter sp. MIT 99-7217]|uniref:quinol dehydrogenase ferredoxin subunit NapH n=1 Tax=Campylobacter sp. MIT 99-7217 TaxID=535091 RepID=UPI001157DB80|nr:quinol dehydrogenase ferredoxin subunit NapH [Campylobacter sp. MIT 99-7217]TQR33009.1 quinol dehydrogenase ferredoxin subunit NapH [Campylobacter sp. MIT 99-7217]